MNETTCCFFGHRTIIDTPILRERIATTIEHLIVSKHVDTFLFGSKSQFNSLCYELVTQIKERHPHIRRIYVRAEFPHIDTLYTQYLSERYEDTYFPARLARAGKVVYVERNREMIDRSSYCLVYWQADHARRSGTKLALRYANQKKRTLFLFP